MADKHEPECPIHTSPYRDGCIPITVCGNCAMIRKARARALREAADAHMRRSSEPGMDNYEIVVRVTDLRARADRIEKGEV